MKYAITFAMMSFVMVAATVHYPSMSWLLIWSALSFGGVALGYAGLGPRVFGKSTHGKIPPLYKFFHLPYLAFTWLVWHMCRLLSPESAFNKIDDRLMIGRRLLSKEVPEDFDHYIDLTAEFDEPYAIRSQANYHSLPILDASVPRLHELKQAVEASADGRVYVHCAQGHGRTGLFALALLLHRQRVQTIEEGLSLLQSLRPAVKLNVQQTHFAHHYLQTMHKKQEST